MQSTDYEVQAIFSSQRNLDATVFYRNGKPLPAAEVKAAFGQYFPDLEYKW
jgi:hypothetical protein